MNGENTDWGKSVSGVLIKDGKVLLARHTYGSGNGKLIIPGGYINIGESPKQAIVREFMEETGVEISPERIIGIRFNVHDWYVCFEVSYVGGVPRSDNDENSEVIWVDIAEALEREDVPGLSKSLIRAAISGESGLAQTEYISREKDMPYSLFTAL